MTKRHEMRCFDYVNRPYEQVREALSASALAIFERSTRSAGDRTHDVGAELRVRVGAVEIAADITIEVIEVPGARSPANRPATRLNLTWRSRRRPGLFPEMTASLWAYALAPRETQLELIGSYDPPLGLIGDALDAIALHRLAEESVRGFLADVAAYLSTELPEVAAPEELYAVAN
ncbi:MAG TPA: hypothetical protein VHW23_12735 [Kofleriaceae bacterium]|jgi:hypothetical protein|nr:hypothetical protein [Kofleriaceae bacterium]